MAQATLQAEHRSPNMLCPEKKQHCCHGKVEPHLRPQLIKDVHCKSALSDTEMTQLLSHNCSCITAAYLCCHGSSRIMVLIAPSGQAVLSALAEVEFPET